MNNENNVYKLSFFVSFISKSHPVERPRIESCSFRDKKWEAIFITS